MNPKAPAVVLTILAAAVMYARDAHACGGCFHEPPAPNEVESVITDHRMVFSVSTQQTVLWDQVRYSGDPKKFAWVLPVHPGARVELSHDAFIAALDAATQPVVTGPSVNCPGSGFSTGSSSGCSFGKAETDNAAFASGEGPTYNTTPGVTVVSQSTVGPYDAVTLRSTMGDSLQTWLTTNGFSVPQSIEPTLAAYASEGFDFIALKLDPGAGVQAMQPVRIVTEGADASLPLRMVAAGVGANVGIELYVIGEGRYHTQNFPDVDVDFTKLAWNPATSRSNFAELETTALASGDARGWITEFAGPVSVTGGGSYGPNPDLALTYGSTCVPIPPWIVPCDASTPSADAADDAGADATACAPPTPQINCDDLDVATLGIHGQPWVTRLRAKLPSQALTVGDLRLEASAIQANVSNLHSTSKYTDPSYDPCPKSTNQSQPSSSGSGCACTSRRDGDAFGTWFLVAFTALGTSLVLRRRKA
jgi:hypothetical protein